jgi:hypothetical protein
MCNNGAKASCELDGNLAKPRAVFARSFATSRVGADGDQNRSSGRYLWVPPHTRAATRPPPVLAVHQCFFSSQSFWKRGSFRSGSNIGSSQSSAGVSAEVVRKVFALLFRREGGDDFLKAWIAAEWVPEGPQLELFGYFAVIAAWAGPCLLASPVYLCLGPTTFWTNTSNRGSPRSGSRKGSTLIMSMFRPS